MTPKEAATLIGCNVRHVRNQILAGRIRATKVAYPCPAGYTYSVEPSEARRYRDLQGLCGFPRGAKRDGCRGPKQN